MEFVVAAGLLLDTPLNYYIRSHFGMYEYAMCGGGVFGSERVTEEF